MDAARYRLQLCRSRPCYGLVGNARHILPNIEPVLDLPRRAKRQFSAAQEISNCIVSTGRIRNRIGFVCRSAGASPIGESHKENQAAKDTKIKATDKWYGWFGVSSRHVHPMIVQFGDPYIEGK